jgi:hypothetical protein
MQRENPDFNQYWYSPKTIRTIVDELRMIKPRRVACLSTPTVFFASCEAGLPCDLFEFDEQFKSQTCVDEATNLFIKFDYRDPTVAAALHHQYDVIVADPPFITEEVLRGYSIAASALLVTGGRILITSTAENLELIRSLFSSSIHSVPFRPAIPSLVYQYDLFINYPLDSQSHLAHENGELA